MDKVILAFEGERTALRIRDILEGGGLAECLLCHCAAEVKRLVNKGGDPVVICGYKLRDETAQTLYEDLPAASCMLVIAPQSMLDMIDNSDIFRLAAPVSRSALTSSVCMLLQMSHRMEKTVRPRRTQEEQALIDQAKAVLMEEKGFTEEQAHRFLQKQSMASGDRLVQTAQMVLDGERQN